MIRELTISLTRYKEPNWLLKQTLFSLARQENICAEVLFLDQQDDPEIKAFFADLITEDVKFSYVTIPARSLSYARNQALAIASTDIVLFIDCDAIAEKSWAQQILQTFSRDKAAVVGGKIIPHWHKPPLFISKSRLVEEQYSILDLGDKEIQVSKVVGASFGVHRSRLGGQAYFDEKFGRRNGILMGGEETDLCNRCTQAGLKIFYNGKARVVHQILAERISYRWLMRRIYYTGFNRGFSGGNPNPTHSLSLLDYYVLPCILPSYLLGLTRGLSIKRRIQGDSE